MSLLESGPGYEDITVFPEESYTDADGNLMLRCSETGFPAKARFQVRAQSGTSSRRQEQDDEGFESEDVYMMRFPRSFPYVLGMQSQIEWHGERWEVFGNPRQYNSSRRTAHLTYTVKRF